MELSLGSEASVCVDTSPSIALGLKDGITMMLRHPLPQQEKCNQDNMGISCSFIQKNFSSPSLFKFHCTFLGTVVSWVRHLVGMLHPFFLNSCYNLFPSLCQLLSSTPITLLKSTSTLDIFKKSTWSLDSGSKVAYKQGLCRII